MRRALVLVWLTVLWIMLWRDLSLANLTSGVAVAWLVTVLYPMAPPPERRHTIRPVPLLKFVAHFGWQLLASNFVVAKTILSPRSRARTGILEIPVPGCSQLVTTVVANAITLTPGTMTIEVHDDPRTLYVHVLDMPDTEDVRSDIYKMLHLALRAFCTDEALSRMEIASALMASGTMSRTPAKPEDQDDGEARTP